MRRKRLVIVQNENQLENHYKERINCSHETDIIRHVRLDDGSPLLILESLNQIKFDSVVVPYGNLIIQCTSLYLTNITHLTMFFKEPRLSNPALTQIIRFLENCSDHLVDLKLRIDALPINSTDNTVAFIGNVTNLFACIDRFQSLRHLGLDFDFFPNLPIRPQMPFLSRLATIAISISGIKDAGWILGSVRQYGRNVESIELYNSRNLTNIFQVEGQLDAKFTVLSLNGIGNGITFDDIKRFCTRFSSLTTLKLFYLSMPMTTLARCLSLLPQLIHLNVYFLRIPPLEEADENNHEQQDDQPPPQITQVLTVRLLTITIHTRSHFDSERLFIPEIFPNLQVLRLRHSCTECPDCQIIQLQFPYRFDNETSKLERFNRISECKRLTRQPFRRCANLHTIALVAFNDNETLVNIAEL